MNDSSRTSIIPAAVARAEANALPFLGSSRTSNTPVAGPAGADALPFLLPSMGSSRTSNAPAGAQARAESEGMGSSRTSNVPAAAGADSPRSRRSKRSSLSSPRSWWCCKQAPRGCQLALLGFSWCIWLLLCMPCFVRGHSVLNQNVARPQDRRRVSLDEDIDSLACRRVSDGLGRTKKQKDPPPGGTDQSMVAGLRLIEWNSGLLEGVDGSKQGKSGQFMGAKVSMEDDEGKEKHQSKVSSTSCIVDDLASSVSCSALSNPKQQDFIRMTPPAESLDKELLTFQGSSSDALDVAIIPPFLEWGSQSLFSPSLKFLTLINTRNSSALYVFKPFSTNPQFCMIGFQETTVAPGGMLSIPVVFLPRALGLAEGVIVVQTSAGGFLVQSQGEGIKSPYGLHPVSGLMAVSGAKLQHSISLHNPYDEPLYIEEMYAWVDSNNGSLSFSYPEAEKGRGVFCRRDGVMSESTLHSSVGSVDAIGTILGLRPLGRWEIAPHCTNSIVDLDGIVDKEEQLAGTLCMKISRRSPQLYDTLILPLNVQRELTSNALKIHAKPDLLDFGVLTQKEHERKQTVFLVNSGQHPVQVNKIFPLPEDSNIISIDYAGELILNPGVERQVATITYSGIEKRTASMCRRCQTKLVVQTNSTTDPDIEVPYRALVLHGSSECSTVDSSSGVSDSKVGSAATREEMCKLTHHLHIWNGFNAPPVLFEEIEKVARAMEAEGNWQVAQGTPNQDSSNSQSIFGNSELLFPMVPIGTQEVRWVNVSNPSDKPVTMQLIIRSEAERSNCKSGKKDVEYTQDLSKCTPGPISGSLNMDGQGSTRIQSGIFIVAEGGVTDAVVHPKGTVALGPILFRPIDRCVWTSHLIFRNNLTGIEWMPVQGSGGSTGLTFLDGDNPVELLQLNFNLTPLPLHTTRTIKQHIYELFDDTGTKAICYKHMTTTFVAQNIGDMPVQVEAMMLPGGSCGSHGFRIDSCNGFYLAPGQATQLVISYQPDFTGGITQRDLQLVTSFGILTVPVKVNLPGHILPFCRQVSVFSKIENLLVNVCFLALFLVLIVFMKMLKQERLLAPDSRPWSSRSSALLFHPVCLRTGGSGTGHRHQKQAGFESLSIFNNLNTARDSGRTNDEPGKAARTFSFLGTIATVIGKLVAMFTSLFCSQETLPNIRVQISEVGATGASLSKLNACQVKQGNSFLISGCTVAEKKCGVAEPGNNFSEVAPQSPSAMDMNQGGSKAISYGDVSYGCVATESSLQQHLDASSLLMVPTASPHSPSKTEGNLEQALSSKSHFVPQKALQSLSPKGGLTEKEKKDKGKRKKRRSNIINLKQESESGCRSGSSSPPSSPASPATPLNSSRPVSPFLQSDSLATTSTAGSISASGPRSSGIRDSAFRNSCGQFPSTMLSQLDVDTGYACLPSRKLSQMKNHYPSDFGSKKNMDMGYTALQKMSVGLNMTTIGSTAGDSTHGGKQDGNDKTAAKDWAAVARRAIAASEAGHAQDFCNSARSLSVDGTAKNRPVLLPSATFPQGGRSSGWKPPFLEERNSILNSPMSSPSLVSTSVIAPAARAPGTRLAKQCAEKPSTNLSRQCGKGPGQFDNDTKDSLTETRNKTDHGDCDLVYDIWGDHFAEISRGTQSPGPTGYTALEDNLTMKKSSLLQHSQSFFAKSGFMMQTGTPPSVNDPLPLPPLSAGSGFSVFSTDAIFSSRPLEVPTCTYASEPVPEQ